MYLTLDQMFDLTVKKNVNKEALVDLTKNKRLSFGEWQQEVNQLANALRAAGVEKGDRVSTFMFNTHELGTTLFACSRIGAIFNPINFRLEPKEVDFILKDAEPKVVIFEKVLEPVVASIQENHPEVSFWFIDSQPPAYAVNYHERVQQAPKVKPDIEVSEDDDYAIMYTSGTTGRPKGVVHRHRDMVEQSLGTIAQLGLSQHDRGLVTAPMFHCAELHCCFLPRVHVGSTNVIMHHFDPKQVLANIEEEKISCFFAAPTMWNMLLQEDLSQYNLESLKVGLYGAAPMAPALVSACKDKLGIDLVQAYGMTEMGPAITFLDKEEQLSKAGSAGRACFNHEVRVVKTSESGLSDAEDIAEPGEVGEIIVRGPSMMREYFKRPEATAEVLRDGWYFSGDLGFMDEEQYLFVADRVRDMVISGGENIYPREVEDLLHAHPGVLDVAVLGEPHEFWGESVVAVVVKKDESVTDKELDDYCKASEDLSNYKRPRRYVFVDELPRNASGKIQKFLLREQFKAGSMS
ncbi:fatty acid--CoA ligase [Pontibacillus yanchengensis]|uniref:Long-chain fatty acid--CoA ligase n=1 Tax=Pontibacillus yanchengensis Y32 TaxID=1385514 RepID=A0A0A2T6C5_9BACI|nr:fatty acid--CoA ligase [Pontibacillus yanchengensis]KGP71332.1 long-chain fatty acid--CoA ligase [Pontibacillus yanchengensis Y32]